MKPSISAVLIVLDEEKRIGGCLDCLDFVDEVIVVDSGSRDATAEIARKRGARTFFRPFDDFSAQKNFAVLQARSDWIFSIDADERVSPELKRSILSSVSRQSGPNAYTLRRRNRIFGRCFRFGGQGPETLLRLFRKGTGQFRQPVHEYVEVTGSKGKLEGELLHESTVSLHDYMRKLNHYTDLEAKRLYQAGSRAGIGKMTLVPVLRFFQTYVLKGGFLDGPQAFVYHALSSFYSFLKYAKLLEIQGRLGAGPADSGREGTFDGR